MSNLPPLTYDPTSSPYPTEVAAARGHIFDAIGLRASFGDTKEDAKSFTSDINRGLDWVLRATIRATILADEMLAMTEEEGESKL